ncbi:MAG: hypothetical protein IJ830_04515 [Alphaproteobacteria bacterium]|nr:hypothetical protein [Alphaproteobacteria bacterium]
MVAKSSPSKPVEARKAAGNLYIQSFDACAPKPVPRDASTDVPKNVAIEVTDEALEACRKYSKLAKSIKRHTRR